MVAASLDTIHISVMPREILRSFETGKCCRFLDGTLGLGGHSLRMLEHFSELQLCGLDRDASALSLAKKRLENFSDRTHFFHTCFSQFESCLDALHWDTVDGVLLDLGVSSLQIDTPERGFSFLSDGPLDMRMDTSNPSGKVAELVNYASFDRLREIFALYGEEPQAARIARAIVAERERKRIETTTQLANIVISAYPASWRSKSRKHPATKTFQALRIAVNHELEEVESFLKAIPKRTAIGGRIAILSFHSLEDRIVKMMMKQWCSQVDFPMRQVLHKPLGPSEEEIAANPRASSAKLRVAERISPEELHYEANLRGQEKYEVRRMRKQAKLVEQDHEN
ncbi:MAG: 16S rRNA (cytosine(1402)-N(4))-methyltransferase RsmH [Desulfovibrionaceae bacterium]|nr:16S rRNA (cytosine(1402)-N(4))-methyltransferase RsmH [Desulfovibrionaceae bacterium]